MLELGELAGGLASRAGGLRDVHVAVERRRGVAGGVLAVVGDGVGAHLGEVDDIAGDLDVLRDDAVDLVGARGAVVDVIALVRGLQRHVVGAQDLDHRLRVVDVVIEVHRLAVDVGGARSAALAECHGAVAAWRRGVVVARRVRARVVWLVAGVVVGLALARCRDDVGDVRPVGVVLTRTWRGQVSRCNVDLLDGVARLAGDGETAAVFRIRIAYAAAHAIRSERS